jgi:hypothetical protein
MHVKQSITEAKAKRVVVVLTEGEAAVFELPSGHTIKKVRESELEDRKNPDNPA